MSFDIENISRRGILKGIGITSGLILAAPLVGCSPAQKAMGKPLKSSVYLQIDPDGTVHLYVHRVEMGQGSRTGLSQIITDELDGDWSRIKLVNAYGDKKFGDQDTDGSTSIRKFYDAFRQAGAVARTMLEQAAAAKWGVDVSKVEAQHHRIVNNETGKSEDFSAFVDAASKLPVPDVKTVTLNTASERTLIGKPKRNVYMKGFVTGSAQYGQDVRREGMLFAVAARPPVVGGKVKSFDRGAATAVKGVVDVVELPALEKPIAFKPLGGVAVLATNTWAAMKGMEALKVEYEDGPNGDYDTDVYTEKLWQAIDGESRNFLKVGDADSALKRAPHVLRAQYFVPHLAHAPMEPPAATAEWKDGKLSIWTCCQNPQSVQETVAPFVGQKPEEIYVEATLLGGACGRKSKPDCAVEAAVLAKHAGRPVKMVWTREDDIHHDYFHTISAQRVEAALDDKGKVTAWKHKSVFPSIAEIFNPKVDGPTASELGLGLLDIPFDIPNLQVDAGEARGKVRIGWLRSVTNIQHAFAIGSFVDEIATARGTDSLATWMELIGPDRVINPAAEGADYSNYGEKPDRHPIETGRLKGVLRKVADMAGYGTMAEKGRGLGIAAHRSFVSYVATAVEVTVAEDGTLKIPRVWMAIDCGLAVNPDRVKAQMEGAVVFALSHAVHGEITAKNGRIQQSNFDTYQVFRMEEAPTVEVEILETTGIPGGVGEPGVPPVAPALANAIYAATGRRIRRLPVGDQLTT